MQRRHTRFSTAFMALATLCLLSIVSWNIPLLAAEVMEQPLSEEYSEAFGEAAEAQFEYAPPKLETDVALYRLYDQFPHLKKYAMPQIELFQFNIPSGVLSIYNYSWAALPNLIIEQNADTGKLLQYIDMDVIENGVSAEDAPIISIASATSLAKARFDLVTDEETRSFYPADPEVMTEEDDLYIFTWIKYYLGIPNLEERLMIAIHPYSGMTVAVIEQRDYSLFGEVEIPSDFPDERQAEELVRTYIEPTLIPLTLSEEEEVVVWFSGMTINYFSSEAELADMPREAEYPLTEDQQLIVDRATARQRFLNSMTLERQWLTESIYDDIYGYVSYLVPVYLVNFKPLQNSNISAIPALIDEDQFTTLVQRTLQQLAGEITE